MKIFPTNLDAAVNDLDKEQLDTPYRDGGWTVRQLVHHLADSHMNAFVVFKLAITEDLPTIKDYSENDWSFTSDVLTTPIQVSISLLNALHQRWTDLLHSFTDEQWHGKHHVAHITTLKELKGW